MGQKGTVGVARNSGGKNYGGGRGNSGGKNYGGGGGSRSSGCGKHTIMPMVFLMMLPVAVHRVLKRRRR